MCRFLLVQSKENLNTRAYLTDFSKMCEKSRTPDSDRQADGWGAAWKNRAGSWQAYKSLKPIWDDAGSFSKITEAQSLVIHARSASFPDQRGHLDYNQPYIDNKTVFVFNGALLGVSLQIEGEIGAQKIFHLLKNELKKTVPAQALTNVKDLLIQHAKRIEGLNIGFIYNEKIYAMCYYGIHASYYTLQYYQDEVFTLIASEPIGNFPYRSIQKGEVVLL